MKLYLASKRKESPYRPRRSSDWLQMIGPFMERHDRTVLYFMRC